ncbi:MAG: Bax inhibitor-1/YccA family protein [Pseudomonadales bacterium]
MQDRHMLNATATQQGTVEINKVLKNTYMLLSMTLLFSAFTAGVGIAIGLSQMAALGCMIAAFVMLFVTNKNANSSKGLICVFVFTGLLGLSLGPMLSYYLAMPNGPGMVMQALGGTAIIFFALSGYALVSRKDFSFMGGFLFVGLIVVLLASIANIFFQMPAMYLATSSAIILIMSGLILFDTSRIIHGGETNYIRATVSLYLSLYNIFIHLLSLLGIMGDD